MASLRKKISCVDLFCGAGGLTHGLIKGGVEVKAGVDLDPACRFPFEENNPGAKFLEKSVEKLDAQAVRELYTPGSVRVLAGCAPCQPFSTYAHRYDSKRDGKWALLSQFGRLVKTTEPDIVTMENVPALRDHEVFDRFVRMLERRNYSVWHDVIDCAYYGVPQTRKRTVLLASRYGPIALIDKTHKSPLTVREAIGTLSPIMQGSSVRDKLHVASTLTDINLARIRASKPGGTWRDWPKHLVAECHRKNSGKTFPSVYGRMVWDKPAPTMTTQCYGFGNGRFGHPKQDRAISLREAALLQSFPKRYRFVPEGEAINFTVIGRLIGNAVPVKLGEAIGRSIAKHVAEYL